MTVGGAPDALADPPTLRLRRRHSRLHLPPEPEIVVGVLQVVLAQHPVSRARGIARKLQVPLVDVGSRAADFRLRPGALHLAVRVLLVVMMTAAARFTAAAPLTLH